MAVKKKVKSKKKVSRKPIKKKKIKKPLFFKELKKIFIGIAVLLSICLTVAMMADLFFQPGRLGKEKKPVVKKTDKFKIKPALEGISENISRQKEKRPAAGLKEKTNGSIKYEIFTDVDPTTVTEHRPQITDQIPRIAIIIDDIGYDKKVALALSDLDSDITFSVLPFSPFGRSIAQKLHGKGSQLMLHLPMEPVEFPSINPGPGAISSAMTPDALLDQLRKNIKDIPHIVGVNNHMGSKLTADSDRMNQVFTILKKENLFFVDSRTAPKSQCKASARLFRLKFAQRDVFLDNVQEPDYITGQLRQLIRIAEKHGTAIGIGHPYKATLDTLARELPKLKDKVKIVRASQVTQIPG